MKVLRTFVEPGDLSIYRQGDQYPRAGYTPAPEVLARLTADGMIEPDAPAREPEPEPAPAPARAKKTTRRKG